MDLARVALVQIPEDSTATTIGVIAVPLGVENIHVSLDAYHLPGMG